MKRNIFREDKQRNAKGNASTPSTPPLLKCNIFLCKHHGKCIYATDDHGCVEYTLPLGVFLGVCLFCFFAGMSESGFGGEKKKKFPVARLLWQPNVLKLSFSFGYNT